MGDSQFSCDVRHGTTTLFSALNVIDGTIIGHKMQRHRQQEFIRLLHRIEREVPADDTVHVILDNIAVQDGQRHEHGPDPCCLRHDLPRDRPPVPLSRIAHDRYLVSHLGFHIFFIRIIEFALWRPTMIDAQLFTDHSFRGWRAKPRKAVRLEIHALAETGGVPAVVRDLSEHGLRLETAADLTAGDQFEVKLPMSENLLAEVVWSEGGSHGCKFSRPIPKSVVSAAALLSPIEQAPLRNDERPGVIDEFLDQTKPQASDKIWYGAAVILFILICTALVVIAGLVRQIASE